MPELNVNDPEVLTFVSVIQSAPQIGEVVAEAQMSPTLVGNFADRTPVMSQNNTTLDVQPPPPPSIA
ncbi:MAG: hypothetical protein H6861_03840 [Rhodospirillales bacterium]|nr:hypothetical protein [Rhodospirillales bacterium]